MMTLKVFQGNVLRGGRFRRDAGNAIRYRRDRQLLRCVGETCYNRQTPSFIRGKSQISAR